MGFTQAIASGFQKYATFEGRACRSEYWFFALFHFLVALIAVFAGIVVFVLVALAFLLPSLSVLVRRLHDVDRSGWWYWIVLIPIVGAILILVWFCTEGTQGDNRFGPDPLAHEPGGNIPPSYMAKPSARQESLAEELEKLAKLRADGTISEDEFQRLKTKLI